MSLCIGPICIPSYAVIPLAFFAFQFVWGWIQKNILGWTDEEPENTRVIHLASAGQFKELQKKSETTKRTMIVDFAASWCPPCRRIGPVFHELSTKYPCTIFVKVDVDEVKSVAQACGITAMPTFQVFKNGRKVEEQCGANAQSLEELIQRHYVEVELPEDEKPLEAAGANSGGSEEQGKDGQDLHQRKKTAVTKITSIDQWKEIMEQSKESNKPVIVDFTASWCGPCQEIAPVFAELSGQYSNGIFVKVDVDEMEELAEQFKIEAMPTFKVLKNGEQVDEAVGASKSVLKIIVGKHAS